MTGRGRRDETGMITPLIIGFAVILIALIAGGIAVMQRPGGADAALRRVRRRSP